MQDSKKKKILANLTPLPNLLPTSIPVSEINSAILSEPVTVNHQFKYWIRNFVQTPPQHLD